MPPCKYLTAKGFSQVWKASPLTGKEGKWEGVSQIHCQLEVTGSDLHSMSLWDRAGSLSPMTSLQVTAETSGEEAQQHIFSKDRLSSMASDVPGS